MVLHDTPSRAAAAAGLLDHSSSLGRSGLSFTVLKGEGVIEGVIGSSNSFSIIGVI